MADSLRETLADIEHRQWAHWTKHMLGVLEPLLDGSDPHEWHATRGPEAALAAIDRWRRQIDTPYDQLTEAEKDSDRGFADKILAVLEEYRDAKWADCAACHEPNGLGDLYMVTDAVWARYGVGDGVLHPKCLEARMDRPLVAADFPDVPINNAVRLGLRASKETGPS